MTTATLTLSDFLLARIAEDQALAAQIHENDCNSHGWLGPPCDCAWPARVVAECEAKRRIVELADAAFDPDVDPVAEHHGGNDGPWVGSVTLKLLAAPYAEHPDYRAEWAL